MLAFLLSSSIAGVLAKKVLRHIFPQNLFLCLLLKKLGDALQHAIKETLDNVQQKISALCANNIVFGIGDPVSDLLDLSHSYKTARYMINAHNYKNWNSILNYGENDDTEWLDLQNIYSDNNLNAISTDIKNGDKPSAASNLKLMIDDFLKNNTECPTPLQIKLFYINVLNTLFKNCLVSGPPSEEYLNMFLEALEELGDLFTPDKLVNNLETIIDFLIT